MIGSSLLTAACVLGLGSFSVTAALTPAVIRFARHIGAVDRGGYHKVPRGEMPLLGGLGIAVPLILLSVSASVAGYLAIHHWKWVWFNHRDAFDTVLTLAGYRSECLTLALGGAAIVALGILDDTCGLRARWKLLGQIAVALYVCLSGQLLTTIGFPYLGTLELDPFVGGLITVFWIVGLINAFNLIDGIDGLATGLAVIGAASLIVLGLLQETVFVTLLGAATAGSVLAFLFYNFPPARIFLGDTGSMFLGYLLSVMSLIGSQRSETTVIVLAPMLALSLPLFETLISIVRRYVGGVPIFAGDNRHTHHRLLRKGYSPPQVVLTLCATGLVLAVAAVMSASIPESSGWAWSPYVLYLGALVSIAWVAGYLRPKSLRAVLERRHRNRVFQTLSRYGVLCLNDSHTSTEKISLLLDLCRLELGVRWIELRTRSGDRLVTSPPDHTRDSRTGRPLELSVKASDSQEVLVQYEFLQMPDDVLRHDVASCLAAIFDRIRIDPAHRFHSVATSSPNDASVKKTLDFNAVGKRGLNG